MANGLAWGTAAKIAARRCVTRGKFLFVILSVAIGVAADRGARILGVVPADTAGRARSIMAADLAANRSSRRRRRNEGLEGFARRACR